MYMYIYICIKKCGDTSTSYDHDLEPTVLVLETLDPKP